MSRIYYLGLALCFASTEMYLLLNKAVFLALLDVSFFTSSTVQLLILLAVAVFPNRFIIAMMNHNGTVVGVALTTTAGLISILYGAQFGAPPLLINIAGGALMGVGTTLLLLLWVNLLAPQGLQTFLSCFGVAALVDSVIGAVGIALDPIPLALVVLATPSFSCILFLYSSSRIKRPIRKDDGPPSENRYDRKTEGANPPIGRFMLLLILYALALGTSQGRQLLCFNLMPDTETIKHVTRVIIPVGRAIGSVFILMNLRRQEDRGSDLCRKAGAPLILVALFASSYPNSLCMIAYTCISEIAGRLVLFSLWMTTATKAHEERKSILSVFGLGYLCFSAGKTLGILAVSLSANLENINSCYSFILFLILLSLVWVEFGSMLTGKDQRSANRSESPTRIESQHDPFLQRCDQVTATYHLSPREQDVFMLLARGHTMTFIAQELSVSRETVKSHVQNIYQKLDVHSKEALIRLVESIEPDPGSGRRDTP